MEEFHVFRTLDEAAADLESPVLTIGNFDGIHVGHRKLFHRTRRAADRAETSAVALTFRPHPVRFFRPEADVFRLTTDQQKYELIRSEGLDGVVALEFGEKLSNLSPEQFVDEIIVDGVGARRVIVGANFAFGKNRAGSTDDLVELGEARGFETEICDEVTRKGDVVSSTRIRSCLEQTNVSEAAELLGRPYRLVGTVVSGEGRGSDLGFPTANLAPETLTPGDGIYATRFHSRDCAGLPAATSIGWRPTFDDESHVIEAYVLDRERLDLYGENAELEFVEFVRPEREFPGPDQLVEQMHDDVERVRTILER